MTGETRVSLVVGLLFIILFGLILSQITGVPDRDSSSRGVRSEASAAPAGRGGQLGPASAQEPVMPRLPSSSEAPARPAVTEPAPVLPPVLPRLPAMGGAPARVGPARVEPARVEPAQGGELEAKTHVVRSGETLSRIAAAYYGQANAGRGLKVILEANRDRVESAAR
ncbi:MAG: hypothetical protein NT031_09965, partial [Planctomycetota bacterium]|nr:hypothetical protein [Planctomycetota bacterium]